MARFQSWSLIEGEREVNENGEGRLFRINRPDSLVLKGKARIVQLDDERIALADVEPEDGVVVLSLHYQQGFRIFPNSVVAEREPDSEDPIPRLRLRVPHPMLRVTLTWGRR
jgi:hypothetical protein